MPKSCSALHTNRRNIGWYGNSGYLKYCLNNRLNINESLSTLIELLVSCKEKRLELKFILFTNNVQYLTRYLNSLLGSYFFDNFVEIRTYDISRIYKFFNDIDEVLITYGKDLFSSTKSTNRVEMGLWLSKRVHVLNAPSAWKDSDENLVNFYVPSNDIPNCIQLLLNATNSKLNNREIFFDKLISKAYQSRLQREYILEQLFN